MKKQAISLLLIVTMFTSLTTISNAQETTGTSKTHNDINTQIFDEKSDEYVRKNQVDKKTQKSMDDDISALQNFGVLSPSDELTANINTDNHIDYTIESEGYENTITILQNDSDTFKMSVQQDDIHNELTIKDDGTMILDGNEIEFAPTETTTDTDQITESENGIALARVTVINRLTNVCPYGSSKDYTYKLGTGKNANINLKKKIEDIALKTFTPIICKLLGVPNVTTPLKKVYENLRKNDPRTKGISYKVTNYAHKKYTNTYIKPIKMYGFKSLYTWYSKKDYKGKTYKNTLYQTKEFS